MWTLKVGTCLWCLRSGTEASGAAVDQGGAGDKVVQETRSSRSLGPDSWEQVTWPG